MNELDIIIKQLRGARQDLQALNKRPCRCGAYDFPHRINGGKCRDYDPMPTRTVSYHHTRQAMIDAGHTERDFA